jgi:uncharacterized membrane protein YoaK (UPF0700 family)
MKHRGDDGSRVAGRASPARVRDAMLVMLSLAAGCVDAVGYLGLGHIFVANMTGNTVLLGLALGQAQEQAVLRAVVAPVGFIIGVAAGTMIVGPDREEATWPSAVTAALAVELAILAALAARWFLVRSEPAGGAGYTLIGLLALAMGVQSAAVRRLGVPGVATTYITGTLTSLTEEAISRLLPSVSAAVSDKDGEERPERATPSARGLVLPADVWLAYGIGAIIVGIIALRWPSGVLSVPVAVVTLVVAIAVIPFRPRR